MQMDMTLPSLIKNGLLLGFIFPLFVIDMKYSLFNSQLTGLVDFDGYYLESDPCLVCNNPEVPYAVSVNYHSFS